MEFVLGYSLLIEHFESAFKDPLFILYIATVIVDIVLGNIKAWMNDDVNSKIGVQGTLKHVGVFTFVIILLPPLTYYLNNSGVAITILGYLVYQYIISIIENLGVMGFKMPDVFEKSFTQLKERDDKNENSE